MLRFIFQKGPYFIRVSGQLAGGFQRRDQCGMEKLNAKKHMDNAHKYVHAFTGFCATSAAFQQAARNAPVVAI